MLANLVMKSSAELEDGIVCRKLFQLTCVTIEYCFRRTAISSTSIARRNRFRQLDDSVSNTQQGLPAVMQNRNACAQLDELVCLWLWHDSVTKYLHINLCHQEQQQQKQPLTAMLVLCFAALHVHLLYHKRPCPSHSRPSVVQLRQSWQW